MTIHKHSLSCAAGSLYASLNSMEGLVMQDTTAQLDISNSVLRDKFLSNASRTLPQAPRGITVECRSSIDALRGTSTPRTDEEPDTLERLRSAITALVYAVSDALKDEPEVVQDNIRRA